MVTSNSDLAVNSNKIKQKQKFPTRNNSMANSSLEVYYGGTSSAIPFTWESQPGTPKAEHREIPLPPLSPPPSFLLNPVKKPVKKQSKSNILQTVLSKLTNLRKTSLQTSPASSPSSSSSSRSSRDGTKIYYQRERGPVPTLSSSNPCSSSCSLPSSPYTTSTLQGQFRLSSPRSSSFDSITADKKDGYDQSSSMLCFGIGRNANARSHGCIKVLFREME